MIPIPFPCGASQIFHVAMALLVCLQPSSQLDNTPDQYLHFEWPHICNDILYRYALCMNVTQDSELLQLLLDYLLSNRWFCWKNMRSCSNILSHTACCVAELSEIYSASAVDNATTGCFLLNQLRAPPDKIKM